MRPAGTPKNAWSEELFERERRAVGELLREQAGTDPRLRLKLAQDGIRALATDDTPVGRLRRYVYIVYALVHHERQGGLHEREIDQLVSLAHSLLKAQAVVPKKSRLARLYGDLHLIRSQIYRNEGEPWEAAWEQQLALYLSGSKPSGGQSFQQMVTANRLLRLGHASAAIEQLDAALARNLSTRDRGRALILRAQAMLLSGRREDADTALQALARETELGPTLQTEVAWQRLVLDVARTGDPATMLRATRKGEPCHQAGYIIEACLWALAVPSKGFVDALPSLAYLRRNAALNPLAQGAWLDCAETLQQAYDTGIPLAVRLDDVAVTLKRRGELLTVDKELLLWAATWRWLRRSHVTEMARLIQCEYDALSLRLSDGRSADVLGLRAPEVPLKGVVGL